MSINTSTIVRQQKLTNILQELGLSLKETQVLMALLTSGRMSPSDLAKLVPGISRTAVYDLLGSLMRRGLASSSEENGITIYAATNIGHVVDLLEQEKRAIDEKQNSLRSVMDVYEQLRGGTAYRPGVRFFEGKDGVRAVHREVQDARKELRAIGDLSAVMSAFPGIRSEDNLKDFTTYNISRRGLLINNPEGESYLRVAPPSQINHVKWLPSEMKINTDTLIWDGHVAIIDYSNPINAVVIDNPGIYETFVSWFEMMWKFSGEEIRN